jgi:hypothetical protein
MQGFSIVCIETYSAAKVLLKSNMFQIIFYNSFKTMWALELKLLQFMNKPSINR